MTIEFQPLALALIARGFAVIPLQPGQKDPDFTLIPRVNGVAGTGGAARRTRDPKVVAAWAQVSPHANVGVCSDDQITILESDDEVRFRQLVRNVSRQMFGEDRELPSTLTSQARPGRPHFFFRATPRTNQVEGAPAIQGLFEWRRENQYVVGPGSLHPTGVMYQIINDVPIAPFPDWLVDVLDEIRKASRGENSRASNYIQVGAAAIARDALINDYALDPHAMIADTSFEIHVGAGERHYFLQAMAGLLHDGERTEEELVAVLKLLRDAYCEAGKGDYEIENLASWTMQKPPCNVEPNLPSMMKGGVIYRDQADYDEAPTPAPPARPQKKSANDFTWKYPAVPGDICEYVLEPLQEFDGWFPRGRPSLIAGSSGTGKSTLMLDLLRKQEAGEYVLGHRGAGLRYLVIFADRGRLANEETLKRMRIPKDEIHIDYISTSAWGVFAVEQIKDCIENYPEGQLPETVFVEGADMLVEDASDKRCVSDFLEALKRLAEHYHIAVILSTGAPKMNKQNAPQARRDMVFGSEAWGRNSDTICVLTFEGDGTGSLRKLTAQHRNAASEEYTLTFKQGLLVEQKPQEGSPQGDVLASWVSSGAPFTRVEAVEAMNDMGADLSRATIYRKLKEMIAEGKLSEGLHEGKVILKAIPKED